jgi:hypothetical protein
VFFQKPAFYKFMQHPSLNGHVLLMVKSLCYQIFLSAQDRRACSNSNPPCHFRYPLNQGISIIDSSFSKNVVCLVHVSFPMFVPLRYSASLKSDQMTCAIHWKEKSKRNSIKFIVLSCYHC